MGAKNYRWRNQTNFSRGIPIYNPTIAKVRVHYDIFTDSYDRQKNLQALTARSLDSLSAMRTTADELILDIWNQVEKSLKMFLPMKNGWNYVVITG